MNLARLLSLTWSFFCACSVTVFFTGQARSDQYALLVGVRQYDRTQLNSLAFCERDVTVLGDTLQEAGYRLSNIVLMTQTEGAEQARMLPLARNIRRELDLLLASLTPEDSILVAFSGHGVQFKGEETNYFCPMDADLADRETLIALSEVYTKLEKSAARSKTLLVDACRNDPQSSLSKSASMIELEPAGRRAPPRLEGGAAALFSCSATQQSFEDPQLRHGVFFYHVIQALKGEADIDGDRAVTFAELDLYATRRVKDYVRSELGRLQFPTRLSKIEGELILARLPRILKPGDKLTNSLGMRLAYIPAGEFMMGSPESEEEHFEEELLHRVRITRPFYLGVYEVTQREFHQVMGRNPSHFSAGGDGKADVVKLDTNRFPVEQVSWYDAVEFCNILSEKEGLTAYYSLASLKRDDDGSIINATVRVVGGNAYRLPTEAEWEYACRAGTTTPFHFGSQRKGGEANMDGNYPFGTTATGRYLYRATTVGSYQPNAFGLYDMHGNVWEWCQDWYEEDYYTRSPSADPQGPVTSTTRVSRGGSWLEPAGYARSAFRSSDFAPAYSQFETGFRIARTP